MRKKSDYCVCTGFAIDTCVCILGHSAAEIFSYLKTLGAWDGLPYFILTPQSLPSMILIRIIVCIKNTKFIKRMF